MGNNLLTTRAISLTPVPLKVLAEHYLVPWFPFIYRKFSLFIVPICMNFCYHGLDDTSPQITVNVTKYNLWSEITYPKKLNLLWLCNSWLLSPLNNIQVKVACCFFLKENCSLCIALSWTLHSSAFPSVSSSWNGGWVEKRGYVQKCIFSSFEQRGCSSHCYWWQEIYL